MSLNGRVDPISLTTVDAFGTRLAKTTASDWHAMAVAAAKDHITIAPTITKYVGVPEGGAIAGYRDWDVQVWLHAHPLGPVHIAIPGESTHGLGNAIDISTTPAGYAWLEKNAARFGFHRIFGSEEWHYQHAAGVTTASSGSDSLPTPASPPEFYPLVLL